MNNKSRFMLAILGVFGAANAAVMFTGRGASERQNVWEQTELPGKWKSRVFRMIGERHRQEAILMLRDYLRHASADGDMRRLLGKMLFEEGRYDEAYDTYYAALMNDPGDFVARNNMGVVLMKQGRREEARRELKDAYDASGEEPFIAANLVCCDESSDDVPHDPISPFMIPEDALMLADMSKIGAAQKNVAAAPPAAEKIPEK